MAKKIKEIDLLAELGRLLLEHETHAARLHDTERRMQETKQRLVEMKNGR